MNVKRMCILAFLTALIITLEQILSFLPGIQLTTVLIVFICITFNIPESIAAIVVYVTVDVLIGGGFYYYPLMLIAWLIFGIIINILKNKKLIFLSLISMLFAFFYTTLLSIADILMFKMDYEAWVLYIINGLAITTVFAACNMLTVYLLIPKLKKIVDIKTI